MIVDGDLWIYGYVGYEDIGLGVEYNFEFY
jgi:hypothetical protein